jgi:hypothetical protein
MIGNQNYVPQMSTAIKKQKKKGDPTRFRSLESIAEEDKIDILEHASIEQSDTMKKEKTVNASKECDCSQKDVELAIGAGYAVGNRVCYVKQRFIIP